MKHYIKIILVFFCFALASAFIHYLDDPSFSLSLCIVIHTLIPANYTFSLFFGFIYLIEQFIWQGHFGIPLLYLIPTWMITTFFNRNLQIPALVLRILSLAFCLTLRQKILGLYIYLPPWYNQFFSVGISSVVILVLLAIFFQKRTPLDQH